jgi:hypothetical protein
MVPFAAYTDFHLKVELPKSYELSVDGNTFPSLFTYTLSITVVSPIPVVEIIKAVGT